MGTTKGFNVAGITHKNDGMKITRLQWVGRYVLGGSKFALEREPNNKCDKNAIKVIHILKSGQQIQLGYVPNRPPRKLADELAPLMDAGWIPVVSFGRVHVNEETGEHRGLQLRYETR